MHCFLVALNRKVVVLRDLDNQDNDQEELLVYHTVILDSLHMLQEDLLVLLDHTAHMVADRHMVAFVGWILAFLHHTSCDVGVGPFLLIDLCPENVEGSHGQDLQGYQLGEFE